MNNLTGIQYTRATSLKKKSKKLLSTAIDDTLLNFCKLLFEANEIFVECPHESLVGSEGRFCRLLRSRPVPGQDASGAVPHDFVDELLEAKHNLAVRRYLFQHRP